MENTNILDKGDLVAINGGDQYTYEKGSSLGEFFGKFFGMISNITEVFK